MQDKESSIQFDAASMQRTPDPEQSPETSNQPTNGQVQTTPPPTPCQEVTYVGIRYGHCSYLPGQEAAERELREHDERTYAQTQYQGDKGAF